MSSLPVQRYSLAIAVENKPGMLSRITGLISRRGFNIERLEVGPTEDDTISYLECVVIADEVSLEQVRKQLSKLVGILSVRLIS